MLWAADKKDVLWAADKEDVLWAADKEDVLWTADLGDAGEPERRWVQAAKQAGDQAGR